MNDNKPSEQAMRAAERITMNPDHNDPTVQGIARIIESEMGELLQIVQELDSRFKGNGTMTDSELRALTEKALRVGEGK